MNQVNQSTTMIMGESMHGRVRSSYIVTFFSVLLCHTHSVQHHIICTSNGFEIAMQCDRVIRARKIPS